MTPDSPIVPFDKHRFRTAAAFYERYRIPYDEAAIAWTAAAVGAGAASRVMDLGCGPGTLALPLACLVGEVVGVDPEPAMLAFARERAAREGIAVTFVEGSSNDLSAVQGPFRLVTMGRSFHWMDRAATLVALDRLVEPGGGVALFHDETPVRSAWWTAARGAAELFVAGNDSARHWRRNPAWAPHETYLLASAFSRVERYGTLAVERIDADHVVGRLLSMSSTSPQRLGERQPEFEAAIREAIAPHAAADGLCEQIVETAVLLARRP